MNGAGLLLVMVASIVVTALAHKRGLQAPLVLVAVATAVSFIPGLPRLEIEPELILSVVLPPLLYSTAVEFSFVNFLRNLWPIIGLGVVLVAVTAVGAGFTAYLLVPEITLAAGLVLGSVVGPSDAVTAVAIGRRLGLPKRVMTILTGESLINDAAALTLFAITTVAVTGDGGEMIDSPVLFFLYGVFVGILVGLVLANVVRWVQRRLENAGLETVLGLILPFTCYLAAEELGASGVIAVVTAGFTIGHSSGRAGYAARIQERDVWRSLDVLLEAFVFAYMGLQARFILEEVRSGHSVPMVLLASFLVLLVVMALRVVYVLLEHGRLILMRNAFRSFKRRNPERFEELQQRRQERFRQREARSSRRGPRPQRPAPAAARPERGVRREPTVLPFRHDLVIAWTGMRGVVTLAAAAGIPFLAHGEPFPGRPVIQTIAFVVAVGTILIQGATLPSFIRRLKINNTEDQAYEEEQRRYAMQVTRLAAEKVIAEAIESTDQADAQRLSALTAQLQRFQEQRAVLQQNADGSEHDQQDQDRDRHAVLTEFSKLRMKMLQAQREALTTERDSWALDDDVYREMLEQLDLDEAATGVRMTSRL